MQHVYEYTLHPQSFNRFQQGVEGWVNHLLCQRIFSENLNLPVIALMVRSILSMLNTPLTYALQK